MAKNYENLEVWKESVDLAVFIYKETGLFPREELYGLTSQLRRAVISIPANIAEGAGRTSRKEFVHFINISLGSLNEVESLLYIATKLGYLDSNKFNLLKKKIEKVGGLLGGFRKYLLQK